MARSLGQTTIDFGSFPGTAHVSLSVASTGVEVGSIVEAWLSPVATNDHSADEHIFDGPHITAHIGTPGVGITIHGVAPTGVTNPLEPGPHYQNFRYGLWTVNWVHT